MRGRRRLTTLATLILAWGIAGPSTVLAADWYQVELLLFLNQQTAPTGREPRLSDPGAPNIGGALPLQAPRLADEPFALLPKTQRALNAHRLQMDQSGRYQSLVHFAWRQPVGERETATTLYFQLPEPDPARVSEPAQGHPAPPPRLLGTIRMSRGRYLHAELDVVYREYLPPDSLRGRPQSVDPADSGYRSFRLRESRRMAGDKLHYLDHPVMGALIIAKQIPGETAAPGP